MALSLAGCGTDDAAGCTEGEVIDDYICENGQWVEYGGGPCEDADCAPNGSCVQDGAQAYCDCDDGYEADNLSCVPEGGNGGDGCDGIDCGAHGSCQEDAFGSPECDCDSGYVPDGLTCVEEPDVDPCEDFTCGENGECIVVNDQAECDCDEGYADESGLMTCEPVDPCDTHDCGDYGDCYDDGGQPACNCDPGYEEFSGVCVPEDDQCDGQDCSGHGTCQVVGGSPVCNCDSGYEPDGLQCVPECTGATECALYVLPAGENNYVLRDYEDTGLYDVLDGPIVGAFGIDGRSRIYVITESSYYRLNTVDYSVTASGSLASLDSNSPSDLDSVAGLQAVYSVPSSSGNDVVSFLRNWTTSHHGRARSYQYRWDHGWLVNITDEDDNDILDEWVEFGWDQPEPGQQYLPAEDANYRAFWVDLDNERGFSTGDPAEACDVDTEENPDFPTDASELHYLAVITETDIHFSVPGACPGGFVKKESLSDSEIFQNFSNAPSPGDVGAATWHNGALWFFTEGTYNP